MVARLQEHRFHQAKRLRWIGSDIAWEDLPGPSGDLAVCSDRAGASSNRDELDVLHVVEGLERWLADANAREKLLVELERLIDEGCSVLVCCQIVPGYWLASHPGVSGPIDGASDATRWGHVLGPLDVRRLRDRREQLELRFERELECTPVPERLRAAMLREAHADPDLLKLAAAITRHGFAESMRVSVAIRRFSSGAAGHFHELWASSSLDERLQLYALAHGGFADPSQSAVLSSLANRGLITSQGPVRLQSRAFGEFIRNDLVHDELLAWRDEGHGNLWRTIWPPLVVLVVLALTFFVSSTPEALAPLAVVLAAGLGAVPVIGSLVRSFRELRQPSGG